MRFMTFTDVQRLQSQAVDADAAFQMDEDTFRAFYDRTARALWAYLSRITGDAQQADDLLQETYYRFLRAAATFETESHRRNSLFLIATNLVRDGRRRRRVERLVLTSSGVDPAEARAPGDVAERAAGRADLSRAMARLKPRERELLWLAYAQGASHREIAEAVGVKPASVKLLLFRARRRLAGLLTGACTGARS
jgi:RNA polymerase sigma-70 factor (ECF subfamily)